MAKDNPVRAANERLAEQIRNEALTVPGSPYADKVVGIANGQVVVVGDSLREVDQRLRQIEPDPARCYIADVGADYETVQDVWSAD